MLGFLVGMCAVISAGASQFNGHEQIKIIQTGNPIADNAGQIVPGLGEGGQFFFTYFINASSTGVGYGALLRQWSNQLMALKTLELPGPVATLGDWKFYPYNSTHAYVLCLTWVGGDIPFKQIVAEIDLDRMQILRTSTVLTAASRMGNVFDNGDCIVPCPTHGFADIATRALFFSANFTGGDNYTVEFHRFSLDSFAMEDDGITRVWAGQGWIVGSNAAKHPAAATLTLASRSHTDCFLYSMDAVTWRAQDPIAFDCSIWSSYATPLFSMDASGGTSLSAFGSCDEDAGTGAWLARLTLKQPARPLTSLLLHVDSYQMITGVAARSPSSSVYVTTSAVNGALGNAQAFILRLDATTPLSSSSPSSSSASSSSASPVSPPVSASVSSSSSSSVSVSASSWSQSVLAVGALDKSCVLSRPAIVGDALVARLCEYEEGEEHPSSVCRWILFA